MVAAEATAVDRRCRRTTTAALLAAVTGLPAAIGASGKSMPGIIITEGGGLRTNKTFSESTLFFLKLVFRGPVHALYTVIPMTRHPEGTFRGSVSERVRCQSVTKLGKG